MVEQGINIDLIILDMTIQGGKGALDIIGEIKNLTKKCKSYCFKCIYFRPCAFKPSAIWL